MIKRPKAPKARRAAPPSPLPVRAARPESESASETPADDLIAAPPPPAPRPDPEAQVADGEGWSKGWRDAPPLGAEELERARAYAAALPLPARALARKFPLRSLVRLTPEAEDLAHPESVPAPGGKVAIVAAYDPEGAWVEVLAAPRAIHLHRIAAESLALARPFRGLTAEAMFEGISDESPAPPPSAEPESPPETPPEPAASEAAPEDPPAPAKPEDA